MKIVGLLLAGGQSRRMGGGDKALRLIGGVPLLERVIERMRPQVETLVLNANGDPARFASFGLPVVPDSVPDYAGPLGRGAGGARLDGRAPPGLLLTSSASRPMHRSCRETSCHGSCAVWKNPAQTSLAQRPAVSRIR